MDKLIALLYTAFGNNFTFYLKSHNYHWTVMGPTFAQDHEFLNGIYSDAQGAIDDYAEQLRRIGAFPKGDYRDIMANTQLADPVDSVTDPVAIFTNLDSDLDIIVRTLQDTYDEAGVQREYGLQNFLADRIDSHRKQQWMIDATLGEQSIPEGSEPVGE
jgi:starvation-inducible DNA-binding protein